MYTLNRGGLVLEIGENLRVVARRLEDGATARGELENSGGQRPRIYPRLRFLFHMGQRWIEPHCDHRYWHLDDFETAEESEARPTDSGIFDLSPEEVTALQVWSDAIPRQSPPATRRAPVAAPSSVEPIFAIGGLNSGDGAEVSTAWPKAGKICRSCGSAESDGAMFTTLAGGDLCDDCV